MTIIKPPPGENKFDRPEHETPSLLVRVWPTDRPDGYPDLSQGLPEGRLCVGRRVQGPGTLCCNDGYMSGRHVEIAVSGTEVHLQDLGSSNGTWVNGRRVLAARLSSGDVVCVGSTVFVLSEALPLAQPLPSELGVVSCSLRMATVLRDLPVAAVRGCAVLLLGETGTGKGFLAHVLHRLSQRSGGPFVALNCATVPSELAESELFGTVRGAYTGAVARAGLVEAAQDGTLFLDEIGELPREIQATLLGLLDNGEYRRLGEATNRCSNARIVAATNRANLSSLLAGTLRPDLLARLSGETLVLPPLRLRREDIVPLTSAALSRLAKTCSCLTSEFVTGLLLHPWPGNIRELNHVLGWCAARSGAHGELDAAVLLRCLDQTRLADPEESDDKSENQPKPLILLGGGQEASSGSASVIEPARHGARRPAPSKEEVLAALERSGGNISAAARDLGRQRPLLHRLMARFGLKKPRSGNGEDKE